MNKTRNIALLLAVMVFGFCVYGQAITLTIGSGDYYSNVGDYDYLPYTFNQPGYQQQFGQQGLSFQSAMGDYGTWVSIQPFGQVWRPYAAQGWRPYTQGNWSYTQYGPTWQGLEPWSWASDHYGNWAYTQQAGWVWIPGYEWHPGRVAWAQGYNSIGWSPMPPSGYDYSRGYLSNVGPQNQFTYYDDDFSIGFGFGGNDYSYGGPYYDPRYRNMYYNQSFLSQMAGILWTFIEPNHFGYDNYADYYYGDDYARNLFDRRLIRISSQPIERVVLERIVRQPVQVRQVRTNEVEVEGRRVRVVSVEGGEERIRKNANQVVRDVVAPAFAEKGKTFKADKAKNRGALNKAFRQENVQARTQEVNTDQIVRESRDKNQRREQNRAQIKEKKKQEIVQGERQGKIKEKKEKGVSSQPQKQEDKARVRPVEPREPVQEQEQQDATRKNRPADQDLRKQQQDEEKQRKDRERQSTIQPETDENIQREKRQRKQDREADTERRADPEPQVDTQRKQDEEPNVDADRPKDKEQEADVRSDEKQDKQKADTSKSKKTKGKKSSKQKDKDKQNQDKPPQN